MNFDWSVVWKSMPELLGGLKLTFVIASAGLAGGTLLGLLFGLFRAYGNWFLNGVAFIYIELVRGTPIMVQVMFIYFALPLLAGIRLDPVSAAIISIVINAGAYIAEIVRGSFASIHRGLSEAGMALGLPFWKVVFYLLWPLSFRRMLPSLGNQFIISLKDTSIFIVIGVGELTRKGQEIMAVNFKAVEVWSGVALLYLLLTAILTAAIRLIEKKMRIL